jgi:hypothetical protein
MSISDVCAERAIEINDKCWAADAPDAITLQPK